MKQTIGEFLATLRKSKGYTQEDVAEKLSISNKTLSSWENDRTTPDALTLPAIAELYDVTVDEILRGEKLKSNNFDAEQTQISEKARLSIIKKKYGKFSIKHFMFTAFGLLAIVLNVLGFAFLIFTSISEWVGIILSIIGFCAAITLTILLIFFEHTTLLSEGIVEGENLSEKESSLALCIKHKNSISFILFSVPYIILAVATLIFFIINTGSYTVALGGISLTVDRTGIFIGFICASAVLGLIYLIVGIVYGLFAIKKYSNEQQKQNHKKNKKLFGVLSSICGGVACVFMIVAIVFSFVTIDIQCEMSIVGNTYTEIHTTDFEKFKENSQTLVLDEYYVSKFELQSDTYILELPDSWKEGDENNLTNLGNNFYGQSYNDVDLLCPYEIMYKYDEGIEDGDSYPAYEIVAYGSIVKVYHDKAQTSYDYILYLPTNIHKNNILSAYYEDGRYHDVYIEKFGFLMYYSSSDYVGKNFKTGEYGLYLIEHFYVEPLAWFCFTIITILSLIVCNFIYVAKRKKLVYKI